MYRVGSTKTPVLGIGIAILLLAVMPRTHAQLDALLEKVPAQTTGEGQALYADLMHQGGAVISELCAKLVPPGKGDDSKVRFAVSGLAKYAIHCPDGERRMAASALASSLDMAKDPEVKAFLIEQLQVCGGNEVVGVLASFVGDKRLGDPAIQALQRIATPQAIAALSAALTPDHPHAARLVKALGALRVTAAVPAVLPLVASDNLDLREAALYTLAQTAPAEAKEPLAASLGVEDPVLRARHAALYLRYAEELARQGEMAQAEAICREMMHQDNDDFRTEALNSLAVLQGEKVLPELLAAQDDPSPVYRGAALLLAPLAPGARASAQWADKAKATPPPVHAAILRMLGKRDDRSARKALLSALKADEPQVRMAALDSVTRYGGKKAVSPVLGILTDAQDAETAQAAATSLLRLPGKEGTKGVLRALQKDRELSVEARKACLGVLAAKCADNALDTVFVQARHEDPGVRLAAIEALASVATPDDLGEVIGLLLAVQEDQERKAARDAAVAVAKTESDEAARVLPFIDALDEASGPAQSLLLDALVELGGPAAFEAICGQSQAGAAEAKIAAISALGSWDGAEAAMFLLDLSDQGQDDALRAAVFDALLRHAQKRTHTEEERVWLHSQLLSMARDDAEKGAILDSLGAVPHRDALPLAGAYLEDAALGGKAAEAIARIVCPPKKDAAGLTGPEAEFYLKKALPKIASDGIKAQAEAYLPQANPEKLPMPPAEAQDDEGFESLFNGRNLDGWVGEVNGYETRFGKIVSRKGEGGNIYTEKDYGNFVLRLEFKLTPGANNGLGIHAPFPSHVAYGGIELQILDNTAEKYKDIHPYQFHGSVYGVVPAKRGFLAPVGEWNRQEVIVQGHHVTVILNGETIVDADLTEFIENGTPDGKEHPGLKLNTGRIAFCGHNDVIEVRHIRVKPLN